MTPMVDVAFLLLIFFMSTTQFKPPEVVSVQLPASSSEIRVPETGTIILTVNRLGDIYISTEKATESEPVSRENLVETIVTWRGRKGADFGTVSDVMDALAKAKTLRFNLMTDLKKRSTAATGGGMGD
ncbi:MAG: hypothetical protein FD129_3065 [bacterium]|nr:MAG: hypothetical protein FD129_3065 [bacterium]